MQVKHNKRDGVMSKYVVVYYSPVSATEQMKDATAEDMKKGMEAWMAWAERCG